MSSEAGELQADVFLDLCTNDNALSVYYVEGFTQGDPREHPNFKRIIAALAATQNYPQEVDYALIDEEILSQKGFHLRPVVGETPDSVVNAWHRDLTGLTAQKLLELAEIIQTIAEHENYLSRMKPAIVKECLRASVQAGYWDDPSKIKIKDEKRLRELRELGLTI